MEEIDLKIVKPRGKPNDVDEKKNEMKTKKIIGWTILYGFCIASTYGLATILDIGTHLPMFGTALIIVILIWLAIYLIKP